MPDLMATKNRTSDEEMKNPEKDERSEMLSESEQKTTESDGKPKPEAKKKPAKSKAYLVGREKRRLLKLFEGIDENKKNFVKEQVTNLAWYTVSVKILQEQIDENGTMIEYNNGGGQSGLKENPDVKTMLGYQKNVNDITRQLTDLVPARKKESRLAAFARASE